MKKLRIWILFLCLLTMIDIFAFVLLGLAIVQHDTIAPASGPEDMTSGFYFLTVFILLHIAVFLRVIVKEYKVWLDG